MTPDRTGGRAAFPRRPGPAAAAAGATPDGGDASLTAAMGVGA